MLDRSPDEGGRVRQLQYYFPPELDPTAQHPIVLALGPHAVETVLATRLISYLDFTAELEAATVIPVASDLARDRLPLALPEQMRSDAYKIVTDEAWHAQFSYQLRQDVSACGGIDLARRPMPFVQRLNGIGRRLPAELSQQAAMLFAIISETLISAILSELPGDRRLIPTVREVVADHAMDEGRHHAYFHSLLGFYWSALRPADRRTLAEAAPQILLAFLEPDYAGAALGLRAVGLSDEEVRQVLDESFSESWVLGFCSKAACSTVRYLCEVGALDDAATADSFANSGLLS